MARRYGWKPDVPDQRDVYCTLPWLPTLPPKIDLSAGCGPVYDQGALGSCTAQALAGAVEFDMLAQALPLVPPSRLFVYYNERVIEGSTDQDAGAALRDGIKALNKWGFCPEDMWPYDITQFTVKPPNSAYTAAKADIVKAYKRVAQGIIPMKTVLASGRPFVAGISVYDSFESDEVAQTGVVPMPDPSESLLGGHAVLCIGYDDDADTFLMRNSWGDGWGMGGNFTLPQGYLASPDLAQDFWTITTVP